MITKIDNIFHVVANELANSEFSEFYITAGVDFKMLDPSHEIQRVFGVAKSIIDADTAASALAAHYYSCDNSRASVSFQDGCGGLVRTTKDVVEFSVRKINSEGPMFSVLFSKLDAVQMATNISDRVNVLEARLGKIELQSGHSKEKQ